MQEIKRAVLLLLFLSILTGIFYPLLITAVAAIVFPRQAGGSLIYRADGKAAGSRLIGQPFSSPKYFWSRPSATVDVPYNALASGGSNLGPANPDLIKLYTERCRVLRAGGISGSFPSDLIMASGSGLDPHISPEAALMQVPRVARERHISPEKVRSLAGKYIEDRQLGLLGARRVNVLQLNLALDELQDSAVN